MTGPRNVPKARSMAPLKTDDLGDDYRGPSDDSVDARTQGMVEDLDRGASSFENDQENSSYSKNGEMMGDGSSIGANDLPANSDRLPSIWDAFYSIILPQYEDLMSNPPSDRMVRLWKYAKLRNLILSKTLNPLHVVNPRGNEGRARQIRDLFLRTDGMQYKIYEAEMSDYALFFNEEARRPRVEGSRRQSDAVVPTKRTNRMVVALSGDRESDADEDLVSSHDLDVRGSSSNAQRVKDAVPKLPPRKAPSHSTAYQSPCPTCHR